MTEESRHSLHPNADVSGLVDGCPGCEWIARDPYDRASPELRRRLEAGDFRTPLDRRARRFLPDVESFEEELEDDEPAEDPYAGRRCVECGRASWNGHWPWCSKATATVRRDWERRDELRARRTIGRIA